MFYKNVQEPQQRKCLHATLLKWNVRQSTEIRQGVRFANVSDINAFISPTAFLASALSAFPSWLCSPLLIRTRLTPWATTLAEHLRVRTQLHLHTVSPFLVERCLQYSYPFNIYVGLPFEIPKSPSVATLNLLSNVSCLFFQPYLYQMYISIQCQLGAMTD